ncbi:MAG: tyrosine-type recombinase/integrase [Gemmataceae bacterium]|nr:tyrosine-type recombinase/integrase [Gemmataceae bacterium]MCI0742032.1 tyrosine-type recombinase/integrase [Gemmataceae bacterium]
MLSFQLEPAPDKSSAILTAGDVIRRFDKNVKARIDAGEFSPESYIRTKRFLEDFGSFIDADRLAAVNCCQAMLVGWLEHNLKRWKAGATRIDAVHVVVSCFKWLADAEITRNPFHKPLKMRMRRNIRSPITDEQYIAVMKQASAHAVDDRKGHCYGSLALKRMLVFLRHTGCRPIEARELRWNQIDWKTKVARLVDHKTRAWTGQPRIIGLPPIVLRMLERLRQRRNKRPRRRKGCRVKIVPDATEHVFLNSDGTPWTRTTFARHFRRHAAKAGLPTRISCYCLRHGFAVRAVLQDVNPKAVADVMGHKDTRMVEQVYAHTTRQDAGNIARIAEKIQLTRRRAEKGGAA